MNFIEKLKRKFEVYILKKGIAKGAKAATLFIISFLASTKIQGILQQYGITLNTDPLVIEAIIGGLFMKLGTMLLNFLKIKPKT